MRKKNGIAVLMAAVLTMTSVLPVAGADFSAGAEYVEEPAELEVFVGEEEQKPEEEKPEEMPESEEEAVFSSEVEFTDEEEEPELFSSAAKANTSASKITSCQGYSKGKIRIQAKVAATVKSVDQYYYLFAVNPYTQKLGKKIAKVEKPDGKDKVITFMLETAGHPEYVLSQYAIGVKTRKANKISSYTRISDTSYVSYPEKTASNQDAYALPATKKGLQTTNFQELKNTKSKTAFFNLPVSILLTKNAETVPYKYNGKTYYFNKIGGYTNLVSQCNKNGIQVTGQIILDYTSATKSLTATGRQVSGANYYAWNTKNTASRLKMEALFSFIGELFGSKNCYVSNWILGNEVNTPKPWHYAGNMSKADFIANYSDTFRSLYNAVRSKKAGTRVFICVDHYWNMTVQGYAAKDLVDSFARRIKTLQKGVNWNLAYHAYPFPLTDPRFWSGKNSHLMTNSSSSGVISLNNLNALTNYIKKTYGSNTRILLSEQGFTSTKGQEVQAAALSLGYYIAACNPMVDGFIIRSYADASHEVAQGLAMGIKGKKAFQVFTNMDSSKGLSYTKTYLTKQVGKKWSSKVPNYSTKRLYSMYRVS